MSEPANQYSLFEVVEPLPRDTRSNALAARVFSDYVVYVDESGDHSLTSIDADYPVFVLACGKRTKPAQTPGSLHQCS